jgi:hypothetical protein
LKLRKGQFELITTAWCRQEANTKRAKVFFLAPKTFGLSSIAWANPEAWKFRYRM